MWAKQKRNVSPNYSCCSKKQFYVRPAAPRWCTRTHLSPVTQASSPRFGYRFRLRLTNVSLFYS